MQLTANKSLLLLIINLLAFSPACGQSESEKHKQISEYERKAYDLRMQGKNEEALKEQLKAVAVDPKNAESLLILSGLYLDVDDLPKANETARKAVELAPNNAKTHYQLAITFRRLGKKEEALKSFRETVRIDPNYTIAFLNMGTTYEDLGDRTKARESYEKALKIDPNYVPAIYFIGELEAEDGKTENALKLFKQAVDTKIPEDRMAEQGGSQRDAKKRLEELETQRKS